MKLAIQIYIGASVILLAVASIGLWHWYWETHVPSKRIVRDDIKEVTEEPEVVVCFPWAEDNIKKGYPVHWGPEPEIQTRDYRKLPEPFGYGSGTLKTWIEKNQANDAKNK